VGDEVKIPSKYVFGPFLLDAGKHILTKNGEKVPCPRSLWEYL
jgi:hypothetical protein